MPSTIFSSVFMVLLSSTVITPSFPTFSIAVLINSPMTASPRGNACHLSDAFFIGNGLADFPELFSTQTSTALSIPLLRIMGFAPAATFFAAFFDYCLRQNNCGCGAVAGNVVGFGGHFLDDLRAHVFKLVFEFDFLGDCHAVVGDEGLPYLRSMTTFLPLGPSVILTVSGELIYAGFKSGSRVRSVFDLFAIIFYAPYFRLKLFIRLSPKCRSVL